MKYSIIFAAAVAASDAYGYGDDKSSSVAVSTPAGYPVHSSSSTMIYPASSTAVYDHGDGGYAGDGEKSTSSSSVYGMTTITPGYGRPPVTVTAPYQAYQTCGVKNANGKDCDKWNDDVYVNTVVKDCDGIDQTITKTDQSVMIYHTKTTTTNYSTLTKPASASKTDNSYPAQETEVKPWYATYEEIHEAQYKDLGKHALAGYPGSGLRGDLDNKQPFHVKKYEDGKWSEYNSMKSYGVPAVETSTFQSPGVYTIPGKDVYVDTPITRPAEATATAKAGVPLTFGGVYSDVDQACTITGAVGAYETSTAGDQTITSTIVKYVTVYCPAAGKCEIQKPTTTTYDHDTEIAYPTPTVYAPGVYHQDPSVVTVTKSGQAVTCGEYKQTASYSVDVPSSTPVGAASSSKPAYGGGNGYGYVSSSSTGATSSDPAYPAYTSSDPAYPAYPSSDPAYPAYPTSSPAYGTGYTASSPAYGTGYTTSSTTEDYPEVTGSYKDGSHDDNENGHYESDYNGATSTSVSEYDESATSCSSVSEPYPTATGYTEGDHPKSDHTDADSESDDEESDSDSEDESNDYASGGEAHGDITHGGEYESGSHNETSYDSGSHNETSYESGSHNETSNEAGPHDEPVQHEETGAHDEPAHNDEAGPHDEPAHNDEAGPHDEPVQQEEPAHNDETGPHDEPAHNDEAGPHNEPVQQEEPAHNEEAGPHDEPVQQAEPAHNEEAGPHDEPVHQEEPVHEGENTPATPASDAENNFGGSAFARARRAL